MLTHLQDDEDDPKAEEDPLEGPFTGVAGKPRDEDGGGENEDDRHEMEPGKDAWLFHLALEKVKELFHLKEILIDGGFAAKQNAHNPAALTLCLSDG